MNMADRSAIRFIHRGELVELADFSPSETILDYLRLRKGLTGTKEGCCEGDCGACTVALGTMENSKVSYKAINSCIQLLGTLDGKELVTVEDLASSDGTLHPVQQAMVEHHASQCGFCTPGFVMSLFVLQQHEGDVDRQQMNQALAGNLCRCTGYRPIIDAAKQICSQKPPVRQSAIHDLLATKGDIFVGDNERFFASPASEKTLARLYQQHSDAVLVAGATDVGLWITKQQRDLPKIIYLGRVAQLQLIERSKDKLSIGAGVTYENAFAELSKLSSDVGTVLGRIGSKQVRAAGTIGGNIANGSPIGDTPPMFIALGASIDINSVKGSRSLPLEDFFIAYGKQDLAASEYVAKIHIPYLQPDQKLLCYKISKRFDQDISAVMAAFAFTVDDGKVSHLRLAFGGMAATPMRAAKTEDALNGVAIDDQAAWSRAVELLGKDFTPMSDMRASADYRLETAKALLNKARLELAGNSHTRILGAGHVA
jgi:xanthine dehydrogenase small subunit